MKKSDARWAKSIGLLVCVWVIAAAADIYDTAADGRETVDNAVKKAAAEKKLALIVWGANWCGWCQRLDGIMTGDAAVRDVLREHYVVARVDLGNRDKHMDLAREYGLEFAELGIPHIMILDAGGNMTSHTRLNVLAYSPRLIAKYLVEQAGGPAEKPAAEVPKKRDRDGKSR
jgi:thioredoxin-related protein